MDRLVEEAVEEALAVQERRLPRDQDEDRPGRPQARHPSASPRCARRSAPTSSSRSTPTTASRCPTPSSSAACWRSTTSCGSRSRSARRTIDGYIEVTRALDMAVAGGENDFTRWGFRDVIARKAMDIVQPDLCAAGGFSRMPQDRDAGLAPSASNACRMPGARRSGSPRRCSSWRRCPTSRRPSGRCRRCWSSSRRQTRSAITWRRSRSSRRRASCRCRPAPGLGIEIDRSRDRPLPRRLNRMARS